ncbi:hypothetical protein LzC2_42300 [Planctomycetes bacterium LzC2]|uniref:Uncharacterized protein n=1 Tax=Alienimonas chondri TaxID=2681879 RepID=A0ABX1VJS0_9PLAN|nr:hypothetical protein [Alienimonas chondri]
MEADAGVLRSGDRDRPGRALFRPAGIRVGRQTVRPRRPGDGRPRPHRHHRRGRLAERLTQDGDELGSGRHRHPRGLRTDRRASRPGSRLGAGRLVPPRSGDGRVVDGDRRVRRRRRRRPGTRSHRPPRRGGAGAVEVLPGGQQRGLLRHRGELRRRFPRTGPHAAEGISRQLPKRLSRDVPHERVVRVLRDPSRGVATAVRTLRRPAPGGEGHDRRRHRRRTPRQSATPDRADRGPGSAGRGGTGRRDRRAGRPPKRPGRRAEPGGLLRDRRGGGRQRLPGRRGRRPPQAGPGTGTAGAGAAHSVYGAAPGGDRGSRPPGRRQVFAERVERPRRSGGGLHRPHLPRAAPPLAGASRRPGGAGPAAPDASLPTRRAAGRPSHPERPRGGGEPPPGRGRPAGSEVHGIFGATRAGPAGPGHRGGADHQRQRRAASHVRAQAGQPQEAAGARRGVRIGVRRRRGDRPPEPADRPARRGQRRRRKQRQRNQLRAR